IVLPFVMIAALPFTALAMLVIWALKLRGWKVFVLSGALCPPTILFLFHKFMGQTWIIRCIQQENFHTKTFIAWLFGLCCLRRLGPLLGGCSGGLGSGWMMARKKF